jgi:uncharacterized membrane protein YeaQ/YmgE (transglycosylase-associated protein family)
VGVLLWVAFGIVAGIFAKVVMPGPNAGGMAVAIPLGVAGGLVGGALNTIFQSGAVAGFDFRSLMMAISGSLFLLFCYRCYAMRATN